MINFDDVTKKTSNNIIQIAKLAANSYRILLVRGSGSGVGDSALFGKIYLYRHDPFKTKYELLINKQESVYLKHLNDFIEGFIEYSNDMDIHKNHSNKKRKIFIVFGDMIVDMLSNKMHNPIAIELFIKGRKLNISLFLLHNLILMHQKILD